MRRVMFVAVVGVAGVLVGLVAARLVHLDDDLDESVHKQEALAEAVDALRSQVFAEGEQPVAPAPERIVDQGPAGERGPRGDVGERGRPPTDAEIDAAVSRYCLENSCVGAPGPGPSAEQVRAAVESYCTVNGCGDVSQVAAAVRDYCSSGACTGQDGTDGAPGPVGPTGPAGPPVGSFTFEGIGNRSYLCADPDLDGHYVCDTTSTGLLP